MVRFWSSQIANPEIVMKIGNRKKKYYEEKLESHANQVVSNILITLINS